MRPLVNNDATDPATEVSGAGVVLSLLQRRLVELHVGRFGTHPPPEEAPFLLYFNFLSLSISDPVGEG